jgi:hypothetical protein
VRPGVARSTVSFLCAAFESEPASSLKEAVARRGRAAYDPVAEPGVVRALPLRWAAELGGFGLGGDSSPTM